MKQPRQRSVRADSTAGKKAAVDAAINPVLQPPAHIKLRAQDLPFWDAIIRARARDTWTDVDLAKAANLARCQSDIERIQTRVDREGAVTTNARGTKVLNPLHALLETLTRREIALSRAVHVHAEATTGKSEDAARKLQEQDAAKESVARVGDDGLIAGIGNHHGGHTLQ